MAHIRMSSHELTFPKGNSLLSADQSYALKLRELLASNEALIQRPFDKTCLALILIAAESLAPNAKPVQSHKAILVINSVHDSIRTKIDLC
jgi:hypothetical protein